MRHAWRTCRALRLPWLLLLAATTLLVVNLMLTVQREQQQQQQEQQQQENTSSDVVKDSWKSFRGQLSDAAPLVENELSRGVKEEENSAREVMDVEGVEARQVNDIDAANEVNSAEPQTTHLGQGVAASPPQGNWRNLTTGEISGLSVLGRRLFLGEEVGSVQENKTFTILIWKHGPRMEGRFLKEYGSVNMDPFRRCSAHNCRITYDEADAATADAILFHLHLTQGPHTFPRRTRLEQRWIWLTDESAYHTFMVAREKRLDAYNGFFNWSMSYRMDTDVPVPYGRTLPLTPQEAAAYRPEDYFSLKPKLVAVMGSNCGGVNKRWNFINELKKHMSIDAYGGCGSLKCPGHFHKDCSVLDQYKFYLAFENANCKEYITEKVWWNALAKGAVPVVMGTKVEDYRKLLPPNSFLHVDDFPSPLSLANHLAYLGSNPEEYNKFHEWRKQFRIANEHGYFQTPVYHYCRICEALNYNSPQPKVYQDLKAYWDKTKYCYPQTWEARLKALTSPSNR